LFLALLWGAVGEARSARADDVLSTYYPVANRALVNLEGYLSRHTTGEGWRGYLQLPELKAELAKGSAADHAVIARTLQLLSSGAPGVELPRFKELRIALSGVLATSPEHYSSWAGALSGNYKPLTDAEFQAAKRRLAAAVRKLDAYLTPGGENGKKWKSYLHWDELQKELAAGDMANVEKLYELMSLYTNGYDGLELSEFVNAGNALRHFADKLAVKQNPQASILHGQRMQQLAAALAELAKQPNATDPSSVGLLLGELDATGQVPELVSATRLAYARPNLLIKANSRIVGAGINNVVHDVSPLRDNIMGTSISGTTVTNGVVTVGLQKSVGRAYLDLHLTGNIHSQTVGYNGPAVIHASGNTQVDVHKPLWIDADGVTAGNARAWADTNTTFTGIGASSKHFRKLITKVATKRAYESKAQAEAVAAQHAEDRIEQRMNAQTADLISQGNRDLRVKLRAPLVRWGLYPQQIHFSSTPRFLQIESLTADSYQLAATLPPPPVPAANSAPELFVQMHESLVNNAAATVLGGRTLDKEQVEKMLKRSTGKIPAELNDEDNRDWSISFESEKPITLQFTDGGFKVVIRGTEFTNGENMYPAMNIGASYKFVPNGKGIQADRQGELEIFPPDFKPGDQLSVPQQTLRRILERRFGKLFKPTLQGEGLELPGRWKQAGKLYVNQVLSEQGWLQLGWRG